MEINLKRYTSAVKRITHTLADLVENGSDSNGWNRQKRNDSVLANKIWFDFYGDEEEPTMDIRRLEYVYGADGNDWTLYLVVVNDVGTFYTTRHTIYDTERNSFCIVISRENLDKSFIKELTIVIKKYRETFSITTKGKYGMLLDEILPLYYSIDSAISHNILDEENTFNDIAQAKMLYAAYFIKADEMSKEELSGFYKNYMEDLLSEKQDPILNDRWFIIFVNHYKKFAKYII